MFKQKGEMSIGGAEQQLMVNLGDFFIFYFLHIDDDLVRSLDIQLIVNFIKFFFLFKDFIVKSLGLVVQLNGNSWDLSLCIHTL